MKKRVPKWLFWTPRILAIAFILFLALFSLDEFGQGFWETVIGLLMHNIPVFVLILVLLIAWKYEWVGAGMFILAGVAYCVSVFIKGAPFTWTIIIAGPAFVTGILFAMNWYFKNR